MKYKLKLTEIIIIIVVVLSVGGVIYALLVDDLNIENTVETDNSLERSLNASMDYETNLSNEQVSNVGEGFIYNVDAYPFEEYQEEPPRNFSPRRDNPVTNIPDCSPSIDCNEIIPQTTNRVRPRRHHPEPTSTSSSDYLLYQEAKDYFDDGYYDDSIKTFREFLRIYPSSVYADLGWIYLGRAMINRGKENSNRTDFNRAQDILITSLQKFRQGIGYLNSETVDELSLFLINMAEANRQFGIPNEEIAHHIEQMLIFAQGEIKSELYTQLGYLKFYNNELEEAMNHFQRSETILAKLGRARVYVEWGRVEDALTIYKGIINYQQDSIYYPEVLRTYNIQATALGKKYYNSHEYPRAVDILTEIFELEQDNSYSEEAIFFAGLSYFQMQNYSKAIGLFNSGLNNGPTNRDHDCLFYKARSVYQTGDLIRALNLFNHFIDYHRNSPHFNEAMHWKEFIEREMEAQVENEAMMEAPIIPR